jgi:hypothetical protein
MTQRTVSDILSDVSILNDEDTLEVVKTAGGQLPAEQKQKAAESMFPRPVKVDGLYWLVLGTLCFCLLLCVLRLVGVLFFIYPDSPDTFWARFADDDKIIGMFTTILSFLLGLFVPSPIGQKGQ